MSDVDDVAVLDDVVLTFEVEPGRLLEMNFGGVTGTPFGPGGQQFVALHHLGAYESLGQIAVDGVSGVHRGPASADRPRAHFVDANGEETDIPERPVEQAREDMDGGFGDAERLEELGALAWIVDLRDFGLQLHTQRAHLVAR